MGDLEKFDRDRRMPKIKMTSYDTDENFVARNFYKIAAVSLVLLSLVCSSYKAWEHGYKKGYRDGQTKFRNENDLRYMPLPEYKPKLNGMDMHYENP